MTIRYRNLTIAGLAMVLAGCASGTEAAPAPSSAPPGVSVSIYQTRTDVAPRRLEVSIANGTPGALRITALTLDSTQFASPVVWPKESTTIPAGATVDLPVQLPEPDCGTVDPSHHVEFDYQLADGTTGTARVVAEDRLDRMPTLLVDDCLQHAVSAVADLEITAAPRSGERGGHPIVEVDLSVFPSGGTGSVILRSLASTTLFMPADPETGLPLSERSLDVSIDAEDPSSTVTLLLTPGRCDPHAIAEDKRGTIMPLEVREGDASGRISVPAADAVRGALYAFVTAACASSPE